MINILKKLSIASAILQGLFFLSLVLSIVAINAADPYRADIRDFIYATLIGTFTIVVLACTFFTMLAHWLLRTKFGGEQGLRAAMRYSIQHGMTLNEMKRVIQDEING